MIIKWFVLTYISTSNAMLPVKEPIYVDGSRILTQEKCESAAKVINKYLDTHTSFGTGMRAAVCLPAELGDAEE